MRVIVRKERPHPGAQLRFTDIDGHRFTCFVTDATSGQLADLELRHRQRARCEDRIRTAKDTGLRNLPLHSFAPNQIWCELVALACELTAWIQMLALDGPARCWEPKRLRLAALLGRRTRGPRAATATASPRPHLAMGGSIASAITRLQMPRTRLTSTNHPTARKDSPRARGTPPTRRDSRAARHGQALKISQRPKPQPDNSRSRNIEANHESYARRHVKTPIAHSNKLTNHTLRAVQPGG